MVASRRPRSAPAARAHGVQPDITIAATDGLPLAATVFEARAPLAWCSIASATGVRRRYYARFARYLATRGISCVTFDYRGIGDSPEWVAAGSGAPGEPPTMRMWGERDLEGILRWVHQRIEAAGDRDPQEAGALAGPASPAGAPSTQPHGPASAGSPRKAAGPGAPQAPGRPHSPGRPLRQFHVGHSAGGQLLGLAPSNRHVEAMVMVASQAGHWRNWPMPERLLMLLLWYGIVPAATRLRGHFPSHWFGMGERLPRGVALNWATWCRNPDFIVDDDGRPLREHFHAWRGRIRAYSIMDDRRFAPRKATEALLGFYAAANADIVDVAPLDLGLKEFGHFGFFKAIGEPLWGGVADCLLRRGPSS